MSETTIEVPVSKLDELLSEIRELKDEFRKERYKQHLRMPEIVERYNFVSIEAARRFLQSYNISYERGLGYSVRLIEAVIDRRAIT